MNYAEFTALLPAVEKSLNREQRPSKPARQRQEGGGRKHSLTTGREQLFFIGFYVKCYATFDVLAGLFKVDRAQPYRWVTTYLPVLEAALGRKAVLPARKIHTVEEFLRQFPRVQEVWVDGTERPSRRLTGKDAPKPYYSGKNKGHRVKNIRVVAK
jgi:hypothetical protein